MGKHFIRKDEGLVEVTKDFIESQDNFLIYGELDEKSGHIFEKHKNCDNLKCEVCHGFTKTCLVCNGKNTSLTTDCCSELVSKDDLEQIWFDEDLDYRDGAWRTGIRSDYIFRKDIENVENLGNYIELLKGIKPLNIKALQKTYFKLNDLYVSSCINKKFDMPQIPGLKLEDIKVCSGCGEVIPVGVEHVVQYSRSFKNKGSQGEFSYFHKGCKPEFKEMSQEELNEIMQKALVANPEFAEKLDTLQSKLYEKLDSNSNREVLCPDCNIPMKVFYPENQCSHCEEVSNCINALMDRNLCTGEVADCHKCGYKMVL